MGRGRGVVSQGVLFVGVVTVGFSVIGLTGVGERLLGDEPFADTLSGPGAAVLGAWMVCAAFVSLALPVLAVAMWGRHRGVRRALLPYVLVLAAQILLEAVIAGIFHPNVVILTGVVFTVYRLHQLASARQTLTLAEDGGRHGRAVVGGILSLGLVFWSANLAFLVLVALPRVAGIS